MARTTWPRNSPARPCLCIGRGRAFAPSCPPARAPAWRRLPRVSAPPPRHAARARRERELWKSAALGRDLARGDRVAHAIGLELVAQLTVGFGVDVHEERQLRRLGG